MSDEIPPSVRPSHRETGVGFAHRIGDKCWFFEPDATTDGWSEAGGVAPTGGCGSDPAQAKIVYRCQSDASSSEVRVVLPDDAPFRACRKGMVASRSKSYDEAGDPVRQVRLLYALKTGRLDDRKSAVSAFHREFLVGRETLGQVFDAQEHVAATDHEFRIFAGEQLANSASQGKGLSDWALWEKVADDAADYTRRRLAIDRGEAPQDNHSWFIQAVKETTAQFGLPVQTHVKKKWEDMGGIGNWREIRKTLGFEWLPSKRDWDKWIASLHK